MGSSRGPALCHRRGLRLLAVCFVIACNLLSGFAFKQYTVEPHNMSPEQLREFILTSLTEGNLAGGNSASPEQIPSSDNVNEQSQQTSDSEYFPENSDVGLSPEVLTAYTDEQKLDSEGSAMETLVLEDGASSQQQEDGETLSEGPPVEDESQKAALPPTVPAPDFIQEAAGILKEERGNGASQDEEEVEDSSLVHSGTDHRRLAEAERDEKSPDAEETSGSTGEVVESLGSEEEEGISGISQDSNRAKAPLEGTPEEAQVQESVDVTTNARRLSSEENANGEQLASETASELEGEEMVREPESTQSSHTGPESPVNAIPVDVSEDSEQTVAEELGESQRDTTSGRRLAVEETTQERDVSEGADGAASVVGQTAEDESAVADNQEVPSEQKPAQGEAEEQSKESSGSSPTKTNLRRLLANEGEPSEAVQVEEPCPDAEEEDPPNRVTDHATTTATTTNLGPRLANEGEPPEGAEVEEPYPDAEEEDPANSVTEHTTTTATTTNLGRRLANEGEPPEGAAVEEPYPDVEEEDPANSVTEHTTTTATTTNLGRRLANEGEPPEGAAVEEPYPDVEEEDPANSVTEHTTTTATTTNLGRRLANEEEPPEGAAVEESYPDVEEEDPANSVTDGSSTAGGLPNSKASLRGATGTNVQGSPSDAQVVDSVVADEVQAGSEDVGEERSASS